MFFIYYGLNGARATKSNVNMLLTLTCHCRAGPEEQHPVGGLPTPSAGRHPPPLAADGGLGSSDSQSFEDKLEPFDSRKYRPFEVKVLVRISNVTGHLVKVSLPYRVN